MDKMAHLNNYNPHYTNPHYKTAQTIWGKEEKGLAYEQSDRLWERDRNKAEAAAQKAEEAFPILCVAQVEVFLSEYMGKPVEIVHIMAGFNVSNGYPYQVFGYKEK